MVSASHFVSLVTLIQEPLLTTATENYLQLPTDSASRPGALGLGQSRATLIIYVWFIYSYLTPLIGGMISDCWLGRRKTIRYGYMYELSLLP